MKKKIILLLLLCLINIRAYSLTYGGCDYSLVSRLKSLVTNINISYSYNIIENRPYFDVTITNLIPEVYFVDTLTNSTYTYNTTQDGEITIYNYTGDSGSFKFYSAIDACYGISLGTKYYKFPTYNVYHADPICSDIPNYSLCKKWVKVNYSKEEFEKKVLEYKKTDDVIEEKKDLEPEKTFVDIIIEIYIKYYYYFLGSIIIICSTIIIIHNKKNKFKL
ncbi:MAG: hypothetical protein E7163_05925 [Firmicutes bacterium]|nr:hypothetical protein [Bacillota bacterium]